MSQARVSRVNERFVLRVRNFVDFHMRKDAQTYIDACLYIIFTLG
jgi:hypothetical protein